MAGFGTTGLTKEVGAVYSVAQDGFATYDVSYSGVLTGFIPFIQGSISPEHPNVVLLSIKITETGEQCNHIKVDCHYEGKDVGFATPHTAQNIAIDFTTSQEPIESHIDFVSDIGGSPSAPKHGAFYDATTGEFIGFPIIDPDEPDVTPSRFAGLRSYLMPQQTYVSNSVEYNYPTSEEISEVGKVFTPDVRLPHLPGTRNWLNTGIRVQNIANVYYRTQKTGMLSGPRKWIPEVYGE